MKFIGLPKQSRSKGEGLRTALGSGLLIAVVLVCIMGAESALSGNKAASQTGSSQTAPTTDMLASIDGDQTVPSLVDRAEETVATTTAGTEPTGAETTATETTGAEPTDTQVPESTVPPITETEESATYYVTAKINLRSGPGTEYESIGTFARGDTVTVIASTSNGWKKLGEGKYVISDFLSTAVPETAKTGTYYATGNINVRSGPGTDFEIVKTLSAGSEIEITAVTSNGWYRTVKDTYILAKLCTSTAPATPTPKPTPTPTAKPTPKPTPVPTEISEMAAAVGLSVDDFELMAKVVEAESHNYTCQVWVAQVIWNRVNYGTWGSGVYGVLTRPGQFSTVDDNTTGTASSRKAILEAYPCTTIPTNVIYFRSRYYAYSDPARQYGECAGNYFCYG